MIGSLLSAQVDWSPFAAFRRFAAPREDAVATATAAAQPAAAGVLQGRRHRGIE
jgi:hypothetical protein